MVEVATASWDRSGTGTGGEDWVAQDKEHLGCSIEDVAIVFADTVEITVDVGTEKVHEVEQMRTKESPTFD